LVHPRPASSTGTHDFQPVRALRAADEDRPREWIVPKLFAHQSHEIVGAAAEVYRLGRNQHP
jgi:hypothetical protein